jgi:hypothetical protein
VSNYVLQAVVLKEDPKPTAKKKSRKSSIQKQNVDGKACMMNFNQSKKKGAKIIYDEVDASNNLTVSERCVAIGKRRVNISLMKRGRVGKIPS